LQVKKLTGETPQHLLYLLPEQPTEVVKLLFLLLKQNSVSTVLSFVSIESVISAFALLDYIRGKRYRKWRISDSTKELIP